jgi:hypothetical protein
MRIENKVKVFLAQEKIKINSPTGEPNETKTREKKMGLEARNRLI